MRMIFNTDKHSVVQTLTAIATIVKLEREGRKVIIFPKFDMC